MEPREDTLSFNASGIQCRSNKDVSCFRLRPLTIGRSELGLGTLFVFGNSVMYKIINNDPGRSTKFWGYEKIVGTSTSHVFSKTFRTE